ncbi:MAG: hypothetical protein GY930_03110 [bacterium]|nr:hypothetical protein [bacterium]
MIPSLALSCTLLCPQWAPNQPEPEPTADETLGLEWVNRFRAAPAKEGALLMERAFPRDAFAGFDREIFLAEVQALKPVPPVFFHTRLIAAARNHASYTVLNSGNQEFGHKEIEGHVGFTGEWSHQRAAAVGYPDTHGLVGESAGAYIRGGIYGNHWGNIVDDGPGGTGGMQKGRGHRALTINARYREFGMGSLVREDGRRDNVQVFGEGSGVRLVGGVAFIDLDSNGMYGVGEGLGDVRIESCSSSKGKDKVSTLSWQSGAYVMEAASTQALELRGSYFGLIFESRAPAGDFNHKFDINAKQPLLDHWVKLINDMNAKSSSKAARASQDLAFWTSEIPGLEPPSPLPSEVIPLRDRWMSTSQATLAGLAEGQPCSPGIADLAKQYQGSLMGSWYKEAKQLSDFIEQHASLLASKGSPSTRERKRKALLKNAGKWVHSMEHPDLRALATAESDRLGAGVLTSK